MELKDRDCSGYYLIKKIGQLTGKKPSPGYIYPLLNDLLKKKFLTVKKQDRKKIYSLTKQGKVYIKNSLKQHQVSFNQLIKVFKPVADKKEIDPMSKFMKMFFKDKDLMIRDMDLHMEFQKAFFKIYSKDYERKRPQFRKIIKETIEKLKKIK